MAKTNTRNETENFANKHSPEEFQNRTKIWEMPRSSSSSRWKTRSVRIHKEFLAFDHPKNDTWHRVAWLVIGWRDWLEFQSFSLRWEEASVCTCVCVCVMSFFFRHSMGKMNVPLEEDLDRWSTWAHSFYSFLEFPHREWIHRRWNRPSRNWRWYPIHKPTQKNITNIDRQHQRLLTLPKYLSSSST